MGILIVEYHGEYHEGYEWGAEVVKVLITDISIVQYVLPVIPP